MSDLFSRVADADSVKCAQALALYETVFPPAERHPPALIRERIASGRNQLFVAEEDGSVILLALLWPLAGTDFTLLDYLATAPAARGRGWGSRLLQEIFSECRARQEFVILEAEDPDFGPNREERSRRRRFYQKNGALELHGVRYFLPPLQGSQPTEMRLMISPNYPAKTMDAALVRHIVTRLYEDLYGRPVGDPLLQSFLPAIRDPIFLR